jgi:3-hydroxyisobutyrate dehydrogenase-like beta-hydroxyacid dehydrogenase
MAILAWPYGAKAMTTKIAIIAPGQMGAAVAARLAEHGVEVLTTLEGRSEASHARARRAGMRDVDREELVRADMLLSILPPGDAVALAEKLAPRIAALGLRPLYVDCNAVSPQTVKRIGAIIARSGAPFVDAGIIGGPPRPGEKGPTFYASGNAAESFASLSTRGLTIKLLNAPIGAASALKMSYAGITKGLTGISAAMMLGARRAGVGEALMSELRDSQPALAARFMRGMPGMYSKAYRWVAEMEEIAAFLGEDAAAASVYEGLARLFERLAEDFASDRDETGTLDALLSGEAEKVGAE